MEIYLLFLSIFLGWVILNSFSMKRLQVNYESRQTRDSASLVSILIPMRNEEKNVKDLITSIKSINYPHMEVFILDDQSSDNTFPLLQKEIGNDSRFTVVSGSPLPDGWVGKVYACHQLGKKAKGDYLFFLDADIRLHPEALTSAMRFVKPKTGLLTGFPHFPPTSLLSHLLVPMQHFIVHFHLPIILANQLKLTPFTAAHGAFMLFQREAYEKIGGHASVKKSLVEDVHIGRKIKEAGYYVTLVNITKAVTCHMYETNKEVWEGFAKNSFPGLGRNIVLTVGVILFYFCFFVFPLFILGYGVVTNMTLLYVLPLFMISLLKLIVDLVTNQKWWLCLFFPLSALAFICILSYSAFLSLTNQRFTWKGRSYS